VSNSYKELYNKFFRIQNRIISEKQSFLPVRFFVGVPRDVIVPVKTNMTTKQVLQWLKNLTEDDILEGDFLFDILGSICIKKNPDNKRELDVKISYHLHN
jgi:hypothetical protein